MMPKSVDIRFSETCYLTVTLKGILSKSVIFSLHQGSTMQLSMFFDLRYCILHVWKNLLPFGVIEHGNVHFASPAVKQLRHLFDTHRITSRVELASRLPQLAENLFL
jgi:hypothetical protein